MTSRMRLAAILLLLTLLLAGCWDDIPIDQRALVLMMGVWPAAHGQVKVAFQIPTAAGLATLGGAPGGGGSGGSAEVYVLTATGPTMMAALSHAEEDSSRDLYLGQTGMVILSSRLDPAQFNDVVATLTRIGPFAKTAYIGTTTASESKFMNTTPQERRIPALYFLGVFGCQPCLPVAMHRTVWRLEHDAFTPGVTFWDPLITPRAQSFQLQRMVLYRGGRIAAILNARETLMMGLALGRTMKAPLQLPGLGGGPASVRAVRGVATPSTKLVGGRLHLAISLQVVGTVDILPVGQASSHNIPILEGQLAHVVAVGVLKTLRQAQSVGADPVGFGMAFLYHNPSEVRNWPTLYRRASIQVAVHVTLHDLGDMT
ncbi:MAG: Ger(x)C family spore germination C-terminal domain-containing protein [Clostridia bacterium]